MMKKIFLILLTNNVGSLKVWGLRPHAPPLTMSVVLMDKLIESTVMEFLPQVVAEIPWGHHRRWEEAEMLEGLVK